jgi:hypothetical protein
MYIILFFSLCSIILTPHPNGRKHLVMRDYGFLTTQRGSSSHIWSLMLISIPSSEICLPFSIFPTSFLPLFSLFYTYPFSPIHFSLLFSLSSSILSRFFKMTGSRGGRLMNPHLQSMHSHISSLSDRHIIPYLVIFAITGSRVGGVELSYPMFCDIHFAYKISMIYIFTPDSPSIQVSHFSYDEFVQPPHNTYPFFDLLHSWVGGFTKVSNPILLMFVPATFLFFPIHI